MPPHADPKNESTATNPVGRFMVAVGGVIQLCGSTKILVAQRAATLDWQPNEWEICYGRIAQLESPEEGLRRELREELGLTDLTIGLAIRVWHIFRGREVIAQNEVVGITYLCETTQEQLVLSDEHQAARWVEPEEALTLVKLPGIQKDVQTLIDRRKKQKIT